MNSSVSKLFRNPAFDLETLEKLGSAYGLATARLHDRDRRPAIVNEIIDQRIVELAEKGERDPETLAESALKALGFDQRR